MNTQATDAGHVDAQWSEPLWTDERIKESAENYETLMIGHAAFAPREWFEGAMTELRDSYEKDRDNFQAVYEYHIGVVEAKDTTIATLTAQVAALEAHVEHLTEINTTAAQTITLLQDYRASLGAQVAALQQELADTTLELMTRGVNADYPVNDKKYDKRYKQLTGKSFLYE